MKYTFFRYPGGKAKFYDTIVQYLSSPASTYVEPFFGGGGFGLRYLAEHKPRNVVLNDANPALMALWRQVKENPRQLKTLVSRFVPTTEAFFEMRQRLLSGTASGFDELAIHQISYSGLGAKSGSPLGGKTQQSKYKVSCRWSPSAICKGIQQASQILNSTSTTLLNADFRTIMRAYPKATFYIDPPYYVKGDTLYLHAFSKTDHQVLASCVKQLQGSWVLSYDDCPQIRELYAWARVRALSVTYTISGARRTKELLICPS